jgi:sodium transport system permease protein
MPLALAASIVAVSIAQVLGMPWMPRLAFVEVTALALPAVLVARAWGGARETLGLTMPRARAVVGAVLLGGSFWLVNAVFVARWFADRASASDRQLADIVAGGDPLALKILVIALAPAVCEELLVRGAIARAIHARAGLWAAVAASSIYFAFMHLSLSRAAPTAVLGALLAIAALRSGSLLPAIIAHLLNNAIALADPQVDPTVATPIALAASAAGIALLWTSARR